MPLTLYYSPFNEKTLKSTVAFKYLNTLFATCKCNSVGLAMNLLMRHIIYIKSSLVAIRYIRLPTNCLYMVAFTLAPSSFISHDILHTITLFHPKPPQNLFCIFFFTNLNAFRILENLHTKKIFQLFQINHTKFKFHRILELNKHTLIITSKN